MKPAQGVNWLGLAVIWFGGMISVPALMVGSLLVSGLTLWQALLAGFVGFSIVVTFMSLESVAAVEQRMDTVHLATSAFGVRGAGYAVGLALGLSLIGWFGVQSGVAGSSVAKIAEVSFGARVPADGAALVLGLLMMLMAVFGFRYLKWLNYLAAPCKVALVVYAVVVAFQGQGVETILDYRPDPEHRLDMVTAIGVSIGFFAVGGVISPDYAKHARTRRDAVLGSVLGVMPSALGLLACGAILAIVQGTYDIVEIYARLDMPLLALGILIVATWTTNVMNVYSSGLALCRLSAWLDRRRALATLAAGVLGSVLAASGIVDNLMQFLILLTTTIPPIAGVLVSDYWIMRSFDPARRSAVNWAGVTAWAAGVGAMLAIAHPIRNVLGVLVAAGAYALLVKAGRRDATVTAAD